MRFAYDLYNRTREWLEILGNIANSEDSVSVSLLSLCY